MICRLQMNPLNKHAHHILTQVPSSCHSWFHNIYDLCLKYNLPHPLVLLKCPPSKQAFKKEVKLRIVEYWQDLLRQEALALKSLSYFNPFVHSLSSPSKTWLSARNSPFESAKAVIVARMISGRYRCEALSTHWSSSNGYCLAPSCSYVKGDIEHLLLLCPAVKDVRERMLKMWESKTKIQYPSLYDIMSRIMMSSPSYTVQFLLYPCSFRDIIALGQQHGQEIIDHVNYLTRTYVYYMHKIKQKIISKYQTSSVPHNDKRSDTLSFVLGKPGDDLALMTTPATPLPSEGWMK